jgi:hypothetical protein
VKFVIFDAGENLQVASQQSKQQTTANYHTPFETLALDWPVHTVQL